METDFLVFNYSAKERAIKELQAEQIFRDLNIEVYQSEN